MVINMRKQKIINNKRVELNELLLLFKYNGKYVYVYICVYVYINLK